MPRRNVCTAPTGENTSNNESEATGNETIADRARQMAERICRLPDDVIASFALTDSSARVSRLGQIKTELSFGMLPVISWLERKRPADKAELVKRRLFHVLGEAVQCARLEVPEYVGGVIRQSGGQTPSDGARRTSEMMITASLFAASLQDWAADIEAEDEQRPLARPAATHGDLRGDGNKSELNEKQKKALSLIKRNSKDGITGPQIAQQVDVTEETVRRWCSKKGALYARGVRNQRNNEGYIWKRS